MSMRKSVKLRKERKCIQRGYTIDDIVLDIARGDISKDQVSFKKNLIIGLMLIPLSTPSIHRDKAL